MYKQLKTTLQLQALNTFAHVQTTYYNRESKINRYHNRDSDDTNTFGQAYSFVYIHLLYMHNYS